MARFALAMHRPKTGELMEPKTVEGTPCRLYLGGLQLDCFMHDDLVAGPVLSEKRTGMRLGTLNGIKAGYRGRMTDREAAKAFLAKLEAKHGAASVWARINAQPSAADRTDALVRQPA